MSRMLLVAAVVAFVNGVSASIADPHILGGQLIKIEEFPYLAAVKFDDQHTCSGVILSPTKILTLASCLHPNAQNLSSHSVGVGSEYAYRYINDGQHRHAVKVTQHPKFEKGPLEFNVGIITLNTPLEFGKGPHGARHIRIKPKIIAGAATFAQKEPLSGENITAIGFGWTTTGRFRIRELSAITVPVHTKEACDEKLEQYLKTKLKETMFCAGGNGETLYDGDFGGPVVNDKKELVGIGLTIVRENLRTRPGVYLSVLNPEIRKFINDNLNMDSTI